MLKLVYCCVLKKKLFVFNCAGDGSKWLYSWRRILVLQEKYICVSKNMIVVLLVFSILAHIVSDLTMLK